MGGNVIDTMVAVGYAQAVVNPCCGNIGGGGFMTIHLADGTDTFINFREVSPAAVRHPNISRYYLQGEKRYQFIRLSGSSPLLGTVIGMETAREKYGNLSRQQLLSRRSNWRAKALG